MFEDDFYLDEVDPTDPDYDTGWQDDEDNSPRDEDVPDRAWN